jgi:hypothetical protein
LPKSVVTIMFLCWNSWLSFFIFALYSFLFIISDLSASEVDRYLPFLSYFFCINSDLDEIILILIIHSLTSGFLSIISDFPLQHRLLRLNHDHFRCRSLPLTPFYFLLYYFWFWCNSIDSYPSLTHIYSHIYHVWFYLQYGSLSSIFWSLWTLKYTTIISPHVR